MDGLEEVLLPEGLEGLEPPLPLDGFVTVCVSPFGLVVVWVVEPSLFVVTSVTVPSFVVVTSFVVPSFWRVTSLTEPSFAVVTSFTVPSAYCSTTVVAPSSFWTVCVDSGISMEKADFVFAGPVSISWKGSLRLRESDGKYNGITLVKQSLPPGAGVLVR